MNYMTRTLGLAMVLLLGFSAATAAGADTIATLSPPSPVPLPVANVTIPSIHSVKLQGGGTMSVLDQVKALEGLGGMPVMFVLTQGDATKDPQPWSLITSVHVRMFSVDAKANPDVADYLAGTHTLTQTAYALDNPPKEAGKKPVVVLWENERDGVLTQPVLEAIYKKLSIDLDPLTAPTLNELTWNNLILNSANHVSGASTRVIILAFRSNGTDPDVVTTTRLRILAGVEFIKSNKAPVVELNEDAHPEIAGKLFGPNPSTSAALIVFNLTDRRIEEVYDPNKLASLTETDFQTFAEKNGVPSFLNARTDVAETFIQIAASMHKQQQAANTVLPAGSLQDASLTLVKNP